MKSIVSAFLIVFLIGCKSKQTVATAAANENTEVSKVIKGHYKNEHDFKTLNIRANAKYEINWFVFCSNYFYFTRLQSISIWINNTLIFW